jgi:hypothetical protein
MSPQNDLGFQWVPQVPTQAMPCQAPLGYFDPLGLSKDGDVETFRRRREAELKNGRVAMFATIGSAAAVTSFDLLLLFFIFCFLFSTPSFPVCYIQ